MRDATLLLTIASGACIVVPWLLARWLVPIDPDHCGWVDTPEDVADQLADGHSIDPSRGGDCRALNNGD